MNKFLDIQLLTFVLYFYFHTLPTFAYLEAMPLSLRLEIFGLISLSIPPEIVSPRFIPSCLVRLTFTNPCSFSVLKLLSVPFIFVI